MKVKYNRTSTMQQNGNRFELDNDHYDLTIFDKGVSGKVNFNERIGGKELIVLIDKQRVKTIVIEDLSRLGRNTIDTISTLKYFDDHDINVIVKNLGIQSRSNNKKNPIWNMVTSVMSSLYELERENILERTKAGRIAYVQNGGKLGRKKNSNESNDKFLNKPKSQSIISLLKKGKSIRDISARLNCSTTTVCKVNRLMK